MIVILLLYICTRNMLLNKKIPLSYIINKIKYEVLYVLVISLAVHYLSEAYHEALPEIPLTIPAFIGTAISVILSFKLNQSYERWWEARKIWGSIVNDSRTFVLQLQTFITGNGRDNIKKMAHRQIAWCYALGKSLRAQNPAEGLQAYLDSEDLEAIGKHNNKPLALLQLHTKDIAGLRQNNHLNGFAQLQVDNTLVRLCDSMGRAERIKSTVFPVTYRLFLHFIIYLFIIGLSISLKDVPVYFEVPILLLLSGAFFLLEKTASHMQEPFENRPTDTAMTAIARTIELNIRQMLNEKVLPAPQQQDKFYIL